MSPRPDLLELLELLERALDPFARRRALHASFDHVHPAAECDGRLRGVWVYVNPIDAHGRRTEERALPCCACIRDDDRLHFDVGAPFNDAAHEVDRRLRARATLEHEDLHPPQTEKLSPQEQDFTSLGFFNTKPLFISDSCHSSTVPPR